MQALLSIFPHYLEAGIFGSILIAVILLIRLLLKKAPKNIICLLWLLVTVRLLLPFNIPSSVSLQPDLRYQLPELPYAETVTEENLSLSVDTPPGALDPGIFPTPEIQPDGTSKTPQIPTTHNPQIPWMSIACIIWVSGTGVMLLYGIFSSLRLKWKVRGAIPMDGCWETEAIGTAFVLGFLKPRIYLPLGLNRDCREHVLAHERCHIRRRDYWLKLLAFLALSLHWYNPLVWISFRFACRDMEMACDQQVVKGKDLAFRKSYSAALLQCSADSAAVRACPVAFAEDSIRQRILAVLNYRKPGFWITAIAVAALLFVAVFFMTSPQTRVQVPEDPVPDTTESQFSPDAEDENGWGLSLRAEKVTSTGCTLVFTQSGADIEADLSTGAMFWLQRFDGAKWTPVAAIAKVQWDAILYMIPLNGSHSINVSWIDLYGELPPGTYRIAKEITGPDRLGNTTKHEYYAEFEITGSTVSDDPLLEECRRAVEAFQNRGAWHLYMTSGYQGSHPSTEEEWWVSGNDFLVAHKPEDSFLYSHTLYRNGEWYQMLGNTSEDQEADIWFPSGMLFGLGHPWLLTCQWDPEKITLESHQPAAGSHEITLHWQGPIPSPLFPNVDKNDTAVVTLWLDDKGNLTAAKYQAIVRGDPEAIYTYEIIDLGGTSTEIRNKINDQMADESIALDPGEFPTPEMNPNP